MSVDTRARLVDWAWLPVSVALVVSFSQVGFPVLRDMGVEAPWFALAALIVLLIVSGGPDARRDPAAFISVAAPSLGLGALAFLMPRPADFVVDLLAFGIPLSVAFAGEVVWPFWWSAVLRRPALPRWWAFDINLTEHVTESQRQAERALADPHQGERILRTMRRQTNRLRRRRAPSAEWAALRDDLTDWEDRWAARMTRGDAGDDEEHATAAELTVRHALLRSGG